jgi:hypothetical protein
MPRPNKPNALVQTLTGDLRPRTPRMPEEAGLGAVAGVPQLVVFAGLLGDTVTRPGGQGDWRILYLDWGLQDWLLVEDEGIVHGVEITDPAISPITRDVIWVDEDASVGRGSRSQSQEGQFLTGDFTRAADFDAPLGGGTTGGPSTGVFCEARTPTCCRYPSRP